MLPILLLDFLLLTFVVGISMFYQDRLQTNMRTNRKRAFPSSLQVPLLRRQQGRRERIAQAQVPGMRSR